MNRRTSKRRVFAPLESLTAAGLLMFAAGEAQAGWVPEIGTTCTTVTMACPLPVDLAPAVRVETLANQSPSVPQKGSMVFSDRRRHFEGEFA